MSRIASPHAAIEEVCDMVREYLKSMPYHDFDKYPNLWCHVIELILDNNQSEIEVTYFDTIINFLKPRISEYCSDEVINWLFLEYHNQFNLPDRDSPHNLLPIANYETCPLDQYMVEDACKGLYRHFLHRGNYDLMEEKLEGYKNQANCLRELVNALKKFRDEREWGRFHNPKDLAIVLNIESGELLELYLWKGAEEVDKEKVKEELADVFSFALLLAEKYDFDIRSIVLNKIQKNAIKYPIEKAKGSAKKYNEL